MGVVVRRYIYRFPHTNYYFSLYTPLVLALFWQQHPYIRTYFFVHFFNVFRSCNNYNKSTLGKSNTSYKPYTTIIININNFLSEKNY